MSQKSSVPQVPQAAKFVSQALKRGSATSILYYHASMKSKVQTRSHPRLLTAASCQPHDRSAQEAFFDRRGFQTRKIVDRPSSALWRISRNLRRSIHSGG
jgi:hypothetical protein